MRPAQQRPRRLARPRTSPFHGGNAGSNPAGDAKIPKHLPNPAIFPEGLKGFVKNGRAQPCEPAKDFVGRIILTNLVCAARLVGVTACVYVSAVTL